MTATIDYVLLPHLRKSDGTNFIRLRVTQNRRSRYIKTNILVEPEDLTRSGNLRNKGKEELAMEEVKRWRRVADTIPASILAEMDVEDVSRYIKLKLSDSDMFRLDFVEFGRRAASKLKPSTGKAYNTALNCLVRYFGHHPDISEITVRAMRGFEDYIRNEGKAEGRCAAKKTAAVSQYLVLVRSLYRMARKEYNDPDLGQMRIPVDIFEYYDIPKPPVADHRDIPAEWVQLMIDQRPELVGSERVAVDTFLLSFGLMGMNAEDMHNARERMKDGVIHYYRTKTTDRKDDRAEMFVRVEPCIARIMAEYEGKDRLFDYGRRYADTKSMSHCINKGLDKWARRNGLKRFTFYAARHTWATLGASKAIGVDFQLITEGLCHSSGMSRVDRVYIRKDWERVWDANAKVLGLFRWDV